MKLYEKIKIVRMARGFSQKQVSEALSMAHATYNLKENGKRSISTDELEQIAILFEIPVSSFFENEFHFSWNVSNSPGVINTA